MDMPTTTPKSGTASQPASASERTVEIDRTGPERYRFVCPRGHPQWDRTNNHIWCPGCQRESEHNAAVDPEHWHVYDKKLDREIHWQNVTITDE